MSALALKLAHEYNSICLQGAKRKLSCFYILCKNCELIKEVVETKETIDIEQEAIIISTYPIQQSVIDSTKECIESFKQTGRKIIFETIFHL